MRKVLAGWPRWAMCCVLAASGAAAQSAPFVAPPAGAPPHAAAGAESAPEAPEAQPAPTGGESAPPEDGAADRSSSVAPGQPSSGTGDDALLQGDAADAPAADAPPLDDAVSARSEASEPSEVSAPPESTRTEPVAPPPPNAQAASRSSSSAGEPRGGWSAGTTRAVGWITFAVSVAASAGLTAAGIAACSGQGLGCIQGQPLIWSGAVVGLSGIPIGLTLVVRGGRLAVAPQGARARGVATAGARLRGGTLLGTAQLPVQLPALAF